MAIHLKLSTLVILSAFFGLTLTWSVSHARPQEKVGLVLQPLTSLTEAAGDSDRVPVEFEFHFQLTSADSGVGINGSFNNWGDVYKCREAEPDVWIKVLDLLPANYQYKFVTYTDTVGQAGVTGWYTDALNPVYGGPYRDSYITVSNPMIYYFLPILDGETADVTPTFTAKISWAYKSQIDASSLEFQIDGVAVANAASYFNVETRRFSYTSSSAMSYAKHTASLRVKNMDGATARLETSFTIVKGVIEAPLTLMFDARSPMLDLVNVPTKATVEWMDVPLSHALADEDGDGLFTRQVMWKPNVPHQYRVVVDEQIYLEYDPNNPLLSETYRSVLTKRVNPKPSFADFTPAPGAILTMPTGPVEISAVAVPSDSGFAIKASTLTATLDGEAVAVSVDSSQQPIRVFFQATDIPEGRHLVTFDGADVFGNAAQTGRFAFGVYPANSGFHYIDAEDDDVGSAAYSYPSAEASGSADIQAIHVTVNESMDSLQFAINMRSVSDMTRVGLVISNELSRSLVDAPENLEVKIPEWLGHGVYATLVAPNSTSFSAAKENRVFRDYVKKVAVAPIAMNADSKTAGVFRFKLALADLEAILGNFNTKWFFTAYSFLATSIGSYEVDSAHGGVAGNEEPDVYDLAFCSSDLAQKNLLANYISSIKIGGPRTAAIGSEFRGAWGVLPEEIDQELGNAPRIRLLAGGGNLYVDSVRMVGTVSDLLITQVEIEFNSAVLTWPVINGRFEGVLHLQSGKNIISASATFGEGKITRAKAVTYDYKYDSTPVVRINPSVANGMVTLDGSQTFSPDGAQMRYRWTQDTTNPGQVTFSDDRAAITSFAAPKTNGEYYYTLTATVGSSLLGWGRTVILVRNDSARTADLDTWHPAWVDSAIAYEIYVKSFSPTGQLSVVKSRMAELKSLGVNVLYFRPLHPSTAIHGYWITDYYGINPAYGTQDDFKAVITEAHRLDMKVIMDFVVNHTVDVHPFMLDALAFGEDSPYHNFYLWKPDGSFHYYYTWVNLPSINFEDVYTRDYLVNMAKWWVQKFRIDGFRCDVAHRIEKDRPSGPAFWQRWRQELKAMKPDIWLLAEADADDPAYYNRKFDSAYDYLWANALRSLVSGVGNANALHQAVQLYQNPQFPQYAVPKRYLEDFDGSRYISLYSVEKVKLAAAILMTSPGLPMMYAGQEVGEPSDRGLVHWSDPLKLKDYYKKLIELRRKHPALAIGRYTSVPSDNNLVYSMARHDSSETFLIVANFNTQEVEASLAVPRTVLPADSTSPFYLNDQLTELSLPVSGVELLSYKLKIPGNTVYVFQFSDTPTGVKDKAQMPIEFGLQQNYPNPFNPITQLNYSIAGDAPVQTSLIVYNVLGQQVRTLLNRKDTPGHHSIMWDGRDDRGKLLGTGMYIYQLIAGDFRASRKMLLLK